MNLKHKRGSFFSDHDSAKFDRCPPPPPPPPLTYFQNRTLLHKQATPLTAFNQCVTGNIIQTPHAIIKSILLYKRVTRLTAVKYTTTT